MVAAAAEFSYSRVAPTRKRKSKPSRSMARRYAARRTEVDAQVWGRGWGCAVRGPGRVRTAACDRKRDVRRGGISRAAGGLGPPLGTSGNASEIGISHEPMR